MLAGHLGRRVDRARAVRDGAQREIVRKDAAREVAEGAVAHGGGAGQHHTLQRMDPAAFEHVGRAHHVDGNASQRIGAYGGGQHRRGVNDAAHAVRPHQLGQGLEVRDIALHEPHLRRIHDAGHRAGSGPEVQQQDRLPALRQQACCVAADDAGAGDQCAHDRETYSARMLNSLISLP